MTKNPCKIRHARVAELADALDLGSSGLHHRGSNPLSRILLILKGVSSSILFTIALVVVNCARNCARWKKIHILLRRPAIVPDLL